MGDRRRFEEMAELVTRQFPMAAGMEIADVAGGKGFLRQALRSKGINRITTWDRCRSMPRGKPGFKREWFDFRTAPDMYSFVIGMHPDEGTDHVIAYAARHRVPFMICPCCVKPSAVPYAGVREYPNWCRHLTALAQGWGMKTDVLDLRMRGCSTVIVGRP